MSNNIIELKQSIDFLENKLDEDLGYLWWKKYVAAAFWSNISTPINLSITLLTAITTGQTVNNKMLSQNVYFKISVITLLISTLNTFFRPHAQLSLNIESMKKLNEIGNKFESIFYDESFEIDKLNNKFNDYKNLHKELIIYKNERSPENQNFLTDLLHYITLQTCLKAKDTWLSMDKEMINEWKLKFNNNKAPIENNNNLIINKNNSIENNINNSIENNINSIDYKNNNSIENNINSIENNINSIENNINNSIENNINNSIDHNINSIENNNKSNDNISILII